MKTRLLGIVVTAVLLAIIISRVDLQELGRALSSANYVYVLPAAGCTALSYLLRTYRWRQIITPTKVVPLRALFPVLMIGFMANNLLPARIGEVVRAHTLGRREGLSRSLALATIMLERLCDGLTLVLFLALLSLVFPLPMLNPNGGAIDFGMEAAYAISLIFLGGAVAVFLLLWREELARQVIRVIASHLPTRIGALVDEKSGLFLQGLHAMRGRRALAGIALLSIVVWSVEACSYVLVLRGFDLGATPLQAAIMGMLLLVVVNLGIMLPSAPGYVGTFQFFAMTALGFFGVSPELGLSVGIVSHGIQYLYVTGVGLVFFTRENLSLRGLATTASTEARQPADVAS